MKVWENLKKLWKHLPTARVPTAFLVLPNYCFIILALFYQILVPLRAYRYALFNVFIAPLAWIHKIMEHSVDISLTEIA